MVIVQEIKKAPVVGANDYQVSLFADSKSDLSGSPEIVGMPSDGTIAVGSSVLTASGELAFMKSDGTWNWVGD